MKRSVYLVEVVKKFRCKCTLVLRFIFHESRQNETLFDLISEIVHRMPELYVYEKSSGVTKTMDVEQVDEKWFELNVIWYLEKIMLSSNEFRVYVKGLLL